MMLYVFLCVSFYTGHFVMVPLNLTYLHCLQHSLFEHLFNLYLISELFHQIPYNLSGFYDTERFSFVYEITV